MATTPQLANQTVVIIGGSSGIGLETAVAARSEGADVVLTGRDPGRLESARQAVNAVRTAAFDVTDRDARAAFFADLPEPVDHVFVTAGAPYYAPLEDIDLGKATDEFAATIGVMIDVGRQAAAKMRSGGTLLMMSGTGTRRPGVGLTIPAAISTGLSAAAANLALELGPIRVNVIAAGFVDTPLSARLVGEGLDARRSDLRERLPIKRVVQAADVAALAVHLMINTALTGATYDIDGGQQLVSGL